MTSIEDAVSMTPINYIKEYQILMDATRKPVDNSNQLVSKDQSELYSNVSYLRSNLILDMKALDEYEKTVGRVYTQFNKDYQSFFLAGEVYLVAYIIGIFMLSLSIAYYLYK